MTAVVIPLSKGMVALVSPEDRERVAARKWCVMSSSRDRFYAQANMKIDGIWKRVMMHRFILSPEKGTTVDHIDGNGLNNQRSNLRLATLSQNTHNAGAKKVGRGATSAYKGVDWNKGMKAWSSEILVAGSGHNLGYFQSEERAAKAYDLACLLLCGEFARPNFPGAVASPLPSDGTPMKVAVVGSRKGMDILHVEESVRESGFRVEEVLHPSMFGTERIPQAWARLRGIPARSFFQPGDRRSREKPLAGYQAMIASSDALVAVWDGSSRSQSLAIGLARAKGIPVHVKRIKGGGDEEA